MKLLTKRGVLALAVAYAVPLLIYLAIFGFRLSTDHSRWGEFGSAMAGIYAPIVALTTLAVLLAQVRIQSQLNDHEFRQSHIAQARADIEFYALELSEKLKGVAMPGTTYREVLHRNFQPANAAALDDESLRTLAANVDSLEPSLLGMWFGVCPILGGLAAGSTEHATFRMALSSSLQKLVALLSFETCVALDNFYRTRTEGKVNMEYRFSPILGGRGAI